MWAQLRIFAGMLRPGLLRRPMVGVAALFIAGIALHPAAVAARVAGGWVLLLGAMSLGAAALLRRRGWADVPLAVAIVAAGVAAGRLGSVQFPAGHIAHYAADEPRLAQLELQIIQPPRLLGAAMRGGMYGGAMRGAEGAQRQVTQARVLRVLCRDGWRASGGLLLLQLHQPHPSLRINDTVRVVGMMQRPMGAGNPGQFDWARYYRRQRILVDLQVAHVDNVQILASPGEGPLDRLRRLVREALARGFGEERAIDHALLRALVLGDGDPQLRDVQDDFMRTGTSHHLAISGMHVAVLGAVVWFACRALLIRPRLGVWAGVSFVILYGLLALPSPPVIRSVLLCAAFAAGLLTRRVNDGVQLLALSVFLMLVFHPLDLYSAGFQLSFLTVLGLMLFTRPAIGWLDSWRDRDELLAPHVPPTWVRGMAQRLGRWLREACVAGVVAWLVAAPLVAMHFNQLNPWAIAASLLLAIPVLVALIGGFVKITLTLLIPPLAPMLAELAAVPAMAMRLSADALAKLPGSDAPMPQISPWLVAIYYGLMLVPLLPWRAKFKRLARFAPASCVLLLLVPLHGRPSDGEGARLTLLSVGAGQCAVLELPGRQTYLIDAGSASIAELSRSVLQPFLKSRGIGRIEGIFISHANCDHYNAVGELARRIPPGRIWIGDGFAEHARTDASAARLLSAVQTLGIPVECVSAGAELELADRAKVRVLWPAAGRKLEPNESSLVLRLCVNGRAILLPGDIQQIAQRELMNGATDLSCDVLIAPHHGSIESTTLKFVEAAGARLVLASSDRRLSQKQRQLDQALVPRTVHRTSRRAITITISPQGVIACDAAD